MTEPMTAFLSQSRLFAAGYVAPSSSFERVVLVPDRLTERPNPFSADAGLAVGSLVEK